MWIAVAQMFGGAGQQISMSLSSLMLFSLLGSPLLVGLSAAVPGFSRFISGYAFGRITDRYGRRAGFLVGLVLALVGALVVGTSMIARAFPGFLAGLIVFASGTNGIQQLRLAAAEMYPPDRRATVLGYVLTAPLAGVVIAPSVVGLGEQLSRTLSLDPLALPWLFFPALFVPAALMIRQVRPDPRTVAADLSRYYPSYRPDPSPPVSGGFGLRAFLAHGDRRVAALAMLCAQASMTASMVTTPLGLQHHGAALATVALSMALHSAGMWGPALPFGTLADRVGRRPVMILGTLLEAVGGGLTAFTSTPASVTFGIVLVGIGWCANYVSSTALIVDSTPPAARGRSIGIMDTLAAASLLVPLSVGPVVQTFGLAASGVIAMAVTLPSAVVLIAHRRSF